MKKVIKLFLFAFVLFGISFVNVEAAEKINVIVHDINPTDASKVATKTLTGTQTSNWSYSQIGNFKETVVDGYITYTFKGWYTENGTAIGSEYTYTDLNLKVIPQRENSKLRLEKTTIDGDTVEEATVNIYARWDVKDETPKKECKVRMIFDEKTEGGNAVNSGNGIQKDVTNTISERDGWTQTSKALTVTQFDNGGTTLKVDGWYDENGNAVPESMYYDNDPYRIRVSYTCTSDSPDEITFHYTLKWKEYKAPIIIMKLVDKVGHGSAESTNSDAVASGYTKTFRVAPDVPANYKYLYWDLDGTHYCVGEECTNNTYEGVFGDYNTVTTYTANAWYQPGIKVTYYSEGSIFKAGEWSFEDVQMISEEPSKPGYEFAGWVDENGNPVTDKTFKVPEITTEPGKAVEVKLYATYNRIMVDLKLNKVWMDFKEDYRKSVTFEVYKDNGETLVGTYTLTEEDLIEGSSNIWSTSASLPRFEEDGTLIEYTVKEVSVEYYTSESESNEDNDEITVTNTINNSTVVVNHVDEDDGTVLATETIEKPIGSDYETSSTTIEDYEYTEKVDGEANGFVTPEEQTVTYYYRALIGTVTVYYVDIDTGDVLTTETLSGKYKAAWEADLTKTFDGYEYVDADGETSGIFGADEIEVTLFYTKNTGDEGEKEDEKEKDDDIITPPHTDSDVVFVEQQLYLDDRKYRK